MNCRGAKKKKRSQLQGYLLLRQKIMVSLTCVVEMGLMRHQFRLCSEETFQKIAKSSMGRNLGKGRIMNDLGAAA